MLAIPSGVGHRRVGEAVGLKVIGAYPPGQSHFTMKRKGRVVPESEAAVDRPILRPGRTADAMLVIVASERRCSRNQRSATYSDIRSAVFPVQK